MVVIVGEDVFELWVLVKEELFRLMGAVYGTIVPQRGYPLVVIRVKVGQEVLESSLGKRLAKIKVIHDNIGVSDDPGHRLYYDKLSRINPITITCIKSIN